MFVSIDHGQPTSKDLEETGATAFFFLMVPSLGLKIKMEILRFISVWDNQSQHFAYFWQSWISGAIIHYDCYAPKTSTVILPSCQE